MTEARSSTISPSNVLEQYQVLELTSPPAYPPFNGKKERSMRDIKSYERAVRHYGFVSSLLERIEITMQDLNDERPRSMLGGQTAREVFIQQQRSLPNRREVDSLQAEIKAQAGSRKEVENARRNAIIALLSRYNLIQWKGEVSTNSFRKMVINLIRPYNKCVVACCHI
jgi:hypothetical protein